MLAFRHLRKGCLSGLRNFSVIGGEEKNARRQRRPAGWSVLHVVIDSLGFGFSEDREAVRDQVNRVLGVPVNRVFRLADAPSDADKIADCGVGEPVAQLGEQGDAVPLRIGLPCLAFAAVVVGCNRDVGDVLGGVDPDSFDESAGLMPCRGRPMM